MLTANALKKTSLIDRNPKWGLKNTSLFLLIYTVVFAGVAALVFLNFKGRSFIWVIDGVPQHVRMLEMWGNLLRDFLKNPSQGLEMWSWNIGYGENIRALLNNIAPVGDPFALLAVFFSPEKTELLYNILVIVRYYSIGIGFFVFCTQAGFSRVSSFMGCFCYAFCGYAVHAVVRHPVFSLSMMYFALICAGVERYYRKKKPLLLVGSVCLAAVAGYYFFFMIAILTIIYALVRFFHYYKEDLFKNLAKEFAKIAGLFILGSVMAGVYLLPSGLYFFEGARKDALKPYIESLWMYSGNFYRIFFASFAMDTKFSYWTVLTFALFAAFSVVAIFFMKKHRSFKVLFVVSTLMCIVPMFGYILTAFTYVSNRWIFGYAFVVTIIMMLVLDEQKNWGKRERTIGLITLVGYPVFTILMFNPSVDSMTMYSLIILVGVVSFFIGDPHVILGIRKGISKLFVRKPKAANKFLSLLEFRSAIVPIIITVGVLMNLVFSAGLRYQQEVDTYLENGDYEVLRATGNGRLLSELEDDSFYRADRRNPGDIGYADTRRKSINDALIYNYRGTSMYLSGSRYMFDFNKAFNILSYTASHQYSGHDGRAGLNALTGIKYFALSNVEKAYLPYGFQLHEEKEDAAVYKNDFALPIGYAYDSFVKEKDFYKAAEVDRDDIMLQSVILPDSYKLPIELERARTVDTSTDIPYALSFSGDMKQEPDANLWLVNGGFMELTFSPGLGETYFEMHHFAYPIEKSMWIEFKIGEITKVFQIYPHNDNWRIERNNILVNLGVLPQGQQTLKVTFLNDGPFSFSFMKILNKDLSVFEANVAQRQEQGLQQVEYTKNKLSGTITADAPGLLAFSIPANKGWSAKVNGKEVDLIPANISFFAVPIEAGENVVELSFVTPGLKAGALLSILSVAVTVCLVVVGGKRRKAAGDNEDKMP